MSSITARHRLKTAWSSAAIPISINDMPRPGSRAPPEPYNA